MKNGIIISKSNELFSSRMRRARSFCLQDRSPPMTRKEVYQIYRSCRHSGNIFFRCSISIGTRVEQ